MMEKYKFPYLENITFICLAMSEKYIEDDFNKTLAGLLD